MRGLLGGKGANLAEMTQLQMPIPNGFTITTEACLTYLEERSEFSPDMKRQIEEALEDLQKKSGKTFGSTTSPLLVSVRSGAAISMPGMMDTILNLGLNDVTVQTVAKNSGNETFAYDCYRRLIQMFGDVVFEIDGAKFEKEIDKVKEATGKDNDAALDAKDWQGIIKEYKRIIKEEKGIEFPQEPKEQMYLAIEAVFSSWLNSRAKTYRRLNNIPDDLGTAVNIQEMVFGNLGDTSGTGVLFTRNPSTGEPGLFGEYLINAQGEDVVSGVRTPQPIRALENAMPGIYQQILGICDTLEHHYKDMQDIEFTIEAGKLFILQTRNGKRSPKASVKVAVDLVSEGIITKDEAVLRIEPNMIDQLLHPVFDSLALASATPLATGLPASPGAASGKICFTAEQAKKRSEAGEKVLLLRSETSPEDIEGMVVAEAVVTSRGGMTSHAAVVARGMGVCCVVGCEALKIDEHAWTVTIGDKVFTKDDDLSIDGTTGEIYAGVLPTQMATEETSLQEVLGWADKVAALKVKGNGETKRDILAALEFGAAGIGLARTEHMFFAEDRVLAMRKMILANNEEERKEPLRQLKVAQKGDFKEMFTAAGEKDITIRLLDPPLHEFLPHTEDEMAELSGATVMPLVLVEKRIEELQEMNPMMGHRGVRLAITFPDVCVMQTEAIIEAAVEVSQAKNIQIKPEIMIPLIGTAEELAFVKGYVQEAAERVFKEKGMTLEYHVGTMIEIPRACLIADEIAKEAEFFSFGTNDLTQMTFGYSRDDVWKFLPVYLKDKLLPADPFRTLDIKGVGQLMKMATEKGLAANPNLVVGVCGEVGGDPASIAYCVELGLDYVSCSPYRVPVARLAAAQATLKQKKAEAQASAL